MTTAVWHNNFPQSLSLKVLVYPKPPTNCPLKLSDATLHFTCFQLETTLIDVAKNCQKGAAKSYLKVRTRGFNVILKARMRRGVATPACCLLIGQCRACCSVTGRPFGDNALCHSRSLQHSFSDNSGVFYIVQQLQNHDTCWLTAQLTVLSWL